ncbi:MAG: hypothetical protein AB2L11_03495 [Syntrophobacteraceae bacterium]
MKRYVYYLTIALLWLAITGCDQAGDNRKLTSPEDEVAAKHYIELLRQGNFDQIENDLDPSLRSPDIRETFRKMADMIPAINPESVKVVGSDVLYGPALRTSNITFEYQFPGEWILINVAFRTKEGVTTIVGFNVTPITDSLENLNSFTLTGKSLIHYTVLTLVVFIPLFTLYALVLCIRTRSIKVKWLWVIFICLGIGKFALNWTTGEYYFVPLTIQLLGASARAPAYGGWTLAVSFPLGALVFLIARKRLQRTNDLTRG